MRRQKEMYGGDGVERRCRNSKGKERGKKIGCQKKAKY